VASTAQCSGAKGVPSFGVAYFNHEKQLSAFSVGGAAIFVNSRTSVD